MSLAAAERDAGRLSSTFRTVIEPDEDAVDPFIIARGLGITVSFARLPGDESGNIAIRPGGPAVITINSYDGESRQRFTCAHEIAHYMRRRQDRQSESFVDYRSTLAGLGSDDGEIYANQFAAALLMPAGRVRELHGQGVSTEDLARRFRTSPQAMSLRLRNLRLS